LIVSLAVVLGAGLKFDSDAGTVTRRKAKRVRKQTQTTDTTAPAPVVDDSPINPGTAKPDSSSKDSAAAGKSSGTDTK
jgi:hypothetical protein